MFFFFGLLSLLMPVTGIVLIVWAVITIVRAITLPRDAPRFPACERCDYAVADLATFTCPECGSDLRKVGIVTPAINASRRGSLLTALLAWTFLSATIAYMVFIVGYMLVGFSGAMSSMSSTNTWSNTLTPNSRNYQSVELVYDTDWVSITSEMEITLTASDGSAHWIKLDPGTMQVRGLEDEPVAWSGDSIADWFASLTLDLTDPAIAAQADEVSRVIDLTLMSPTYGQAPTLRHHTSMSIPVGGPITPPLSRGPSGVAVLAGLAIAVLIYGLGIIFIINKRRKLLRVVDNF